MASNANLTNKLDKLDALFQIGAQLDSIEANLLEQTNKVAAQELKIIALDHKLQEAMNAIDNLENRSRRKNQCLLHLPEKSETGYRMETYLAKILSPLLTIPLEEQDIEIAHRICPFELQAPHNDFQASPSTKEGLHHGGSEILHAGAQ